jgi:pyruvate dehydrogenase E2 component (dihydrolipoamide acetyltransferase)
MPYVDGTLLYIGVEKGKAAKVNGIIAIVGKEGEDYSKILAEETKKEEAKEEEAPKEEEQAAQTSAQQSAPAPSTTTAAAAPKKGDATVVRMPLLSDTMKEGKIVAWHKKEGDKVKSDDVLADVETDKATMEVMPYADGTLLYIGVKEGEAAKVNGIIAIVGKPGTDIKPYLENDLEVQDEETAGQPKDTDQSGVRAKTEIISVKAEEIETTEDDERVKASPLAKKLAEEKGIDIRQVKGSGDNGRIIKRDVDHFEPFQATAPAQQGQKQAMQLQSVALGQEGYTDHPLSQMRKVIAQRLSESKFAAPHFYLKITVTMDRAIEARKAINQISPVKVSFNDLIVKAAAMALRKHPEVNSSWMADFIRQNQHIHIGNAVAIEDGLIVPVIKFADQKSLSQIAEESKSLAEKARNKKLQPPEFSGNTFTISNLGMMDIDEFTAIINPPASCILAVGKIMAEPVVEDNEVVVRQLLKLTLSCDHRVVDGAVGDTFLKTLKAHLENPVTMLV